MVNSDIRKKAMEILKVSPVPFLALPGITALSNIISDESDSLIIAIILLVVTFVINIGSNYMLIRGWIEGKGDLKHILVPFQSEVYRRKIIPLSLAEWGILFVAALPVAAVFVLTRDSFMLLMSGAFILMLLVLFLVVAVAISMIWYIYVMEPELKVGEMIRKSASLMGKHWAGWLGFSFSLVIIPAVISALFSDLLDSTLISILLIPVEAYIAIARSGYAYENILMAEKRKEQMANQPVDVMPVEAVQELPAAENIQPAEETIEEITEKLSAEVSKDIVLERPAVKAEELITESEEHTEENIE